MEPDAEIAVELWDEAGALLRTTTRTQNAA
jgi:hypothetical protein